MAARSPVLLGVLLSLLSSAAALHGGQRGEHDAEDPRVARGWRRRLQWSSSWQGYSAAPLCYSRMLQ
jgi:hypothetical protein